MAKLISMVQIEGGQILRSDLDAVMTSYNAHKVLTDIAKGDGGNYNVNELLAALKEVVDTQLGDGSGSVDERIEAVKTLLQEKIDEINNKVIYDRVKVTGTINEENSFVATSKITSIIDEFKPEQEVIVFFEDNTPAYTSTGAKLTYNIDSNSLASQPHKRVYDAETKEATYEPAEVNCRVKLFPIAKYALGNLPEDFLLDNEELALTYTTEVINDIVLGLAQNEELIEDIKALVGNELVQEQIKQITDALALRIDALELALADKVDEVTLEEDHLVVDGEKTKIITKYKSSIPSTVALGGLEKGFVAEEGMNIEDLLFKLLHQYVQPGINFTGTSGTYEKGSVLTQKQFTVKGTREADKLTRLEIYAGAQLLEGKDVTVEGNDSLTVTVDEIKENTTFKGKVSDGRTNRESSLTVNFVHPIYYGVIGADTELNSGVIKGLTKKVTGVANQTVSYTATNQRMVIAVPSNWTLKTAIDPNKFDMTKSFELVRTDVNCLDDSVESYKVYMSAATNQKAFAVTFNF